MHFSMKIKLLENRTFYIWENLVILQKSQHVQNSLHELKFVF